MTRNFLEGLGLSKDIIDKVISENGNDIENARKSESDKFATERETLTNRANDLQNQLNQRDADMKDLQDKLTAAQTDATKVTEATEALTSLQTKYDAERQEWSQKQAEQAYEFAVKTKANELKFSSAAAKKDFIREAIAAKLQQNGDDLMGYNDFVTKYKENDPGAFAPDESPASQTSEPNTAPAPTIVLPTGNGNTGTTGNVFGFNFHGVRPAPKG